MPAGADHGPDTCPVCAAAEGAGHEEGTLQTYTEEQAQELISAAVAAAVASLQSELADLRAAAVDGETESRITAAVAAAIAPLEEQLTTARTERDAATADLNAATARLDQIAAAQEAADAAAVAAAEIAERTDARVAAIAAVAHFTDEQIAARSPEWAAMDDASFGVLVATLQSSAAVSPGRVVRPSPLTASETPPAAGGSLLGAGLAAIRRGSAPRTV